MKDGCINPTTNHIMSANNSNSKTNQAPTGTNGGSSSHHLWQQMNQMPKFSTDHMMHPGKSAH